MCVAVAGRVVAAQLTEVGARVAEVRSFAARECAALVARAAQAPPGPASREVLYAAAYVLAEYCTSVFMSFIFCTRCLTDKLLCKESYGRQRKN